MARSKRTPTTILDEIMNEAIRLPGCPQIIVTRAWAWAWLHRTGVRQCATGDNLFFNCQYMTCGPQARKVNEPLTDLTDPTVVRFLSQVEAAILRDAA